MEIRENDKICIIAPICSKLDKRKTKRVLETITRESRIVGLDLSNIQDCTIDFIEEVKKITNKNLGIFNIPSDIFVLFNIMNLDKNIQLFVSESDFEENSRRLINRKFAVV